MRYYIFPLEAAEMKAGNRTGFAYALKNKDRWVDASDILSVEINTYDKSVTHIVYNNKVYYIHQDYVNISENYRVYICKESKMESELID